MARKDFHFDFNEDADPVEELHRLRAATAKHFKTTEALLEYYNSVPPLEEIKIRLRAEIAEKKARQARPPHGETGETIEKPIARRKTVKRLTHA